MKTIRRKRASLVTNSRWAAYATAGAATALAGVNSAEAAIHYSGPINQAFTGSPQSALFSVGVNGDFVPGHNGNFAGFFVGDSASAGTAMFVGSAAGIYRYPFKLASNVNVSVAGPFVANSGNNFGTLASGAAYGQWLSAGTGFVGFKFNDGAGVEYGWVRFTMDGSGAANTFTLVDYAWGDVGDQVKTGQTQAVPEPGSLGLLAVGAAGLLLWRRQRTTAAGKE